MAETAAKVMRARNCQSEDGQRNQPGKEYQEGSQSNERNRRPNEVGLQPHVKNPRQARQGRNQRCSHPRCPVAGHWGREARAGQHTEVRTADGSIRVMLRCVDGVPELTTCPSASPEHRVACHYADQLEPNTLAEIAGR